MQKQKDSGQDAGNLLLSMLYKTEDSFSNYKNVKREVPERDTFLKMIVDNVYNYCGAIEIAEPNT